MKSVIRKLALLGTCAAFALPAVAAPGLLSKFVNNPVPAQANKSISASALSNFSDAWWVPSESGWGVNIVQQGDALVLVFYIFDDDNTPIWFRGVTTKVGENDFRGTVYLDSGTSFREPVFGPVPQPYQAVGEVRFQPTTPYDAAMTYSVGTTTTAKALSRISFAPNDYSGAHSAVVTARINACGEKTGDLSGSMQSEATFNNGTASLALSGAGVSCVVSGPFSQRGKLGVIAGGSYTCSDGSSGQANVDAWDTQGSSFSAIVTTSSGACTESGRIAGVRGM